MSRGLAEVVKTDSDTGGDGIRLRVRLSQPFAKVIRGARDAARQTQAYEKHPHPHLVVGWTSSVLRWRNDAFLQLILAQQPSGQYSFKRDFDQDRGRYLVLVAFEKESDSQKLARCLGAEDVTRYPGYAS